MLVAHSNSHIYFFAFAPFCLCVHACYLLSFSSLVLVSLDLLFIQIFLLLLFHIFAMIAIFFSYVSQVFFEIVIHFKKLVHLFCIFLLLFHVPNFFCPSCFTILFSFVLLLTFVVSFFLQVLFCHFVSILSHFFLHEVLLG